MTVLEVIKRGTEFLEKKGVDSPRLQVELLLAHTLRVPRLNLYLDFQRSLSDTELDRVRDLIRRRAAREPLQHLIGSTNFCGFELKLTRDVLVPRLETEELAERGWRFLNVLVAGGIAAPAALDFGTGSGCLAIALAARCASARVWALDISGAALAVARANAEANGVAERIEFLESNGFGALPVGQRFDLIISNPPYIRTAEIGELSPEVRDFDPRIALDGGAEGLDFYQVLAAEGAAWLNPGGKLMAEFGDGQAVAVAGLFTQHGWTVESIDPDLSQRPRIVIARVAES